MEKYLLSNYSQCSRHFGFFDSFPFVQISAHSVLGLTLPSHIFGFYCIIRKTPARMNPIKLYLLNLQFWSFVVDFLYTTLITPVFFFPALASCSIGALAWFGVPPIRIFQLGLVGYGGLATASVLIFDYRDHSLSTAQKSNSVFKRKTVRTVWHTSNFLITFLVCWALSASLDDVGSGRMTYLRVNPCPVPEYFTECNFVLSRSRNVFTHSTLAYLMYISMQTLILALHSSYKIFMIRSSLVSVATKSVQKSLFVGTCIQVLVPLFFLIVPIAYCYFAIFYEYYNQSFLNFTGFLISFHGLIATVMMILVNSSYRSYTKNLVGSWIHSSSKNTQTISVVVPRASRMNDF